MQTMSPQRVLSPSFLTVAQTLFRALRQLFIIPRDPKHRLLGGILIQINIGRSARTLSLIVPQTLLVVSDEVIESPMSATIMIAVEACAA
jgi:hypothetical protein